MTIDEAKQLGFSDTEIKDTFWEKNSNKLGELYSLGVTDDEIRSAVDEVSGGAASFLYGDATSAKSSTKKENTPIQKIDTTIEDANKLARKQLKAERDMGIITPSEYDQKLRDMMREETTITSATDWNKETPEDKISKALASANTLKLEGSPTRLITDTLKEIKNGKAKDNASKNIALSYLAKNNIINGYNEDTNEVILPDGRNVPFESSFIDGILANKNQFGYGALYGTIGSALGLRGGPNATIKMGIAGSAIGTSSGWYKDAKNAQKLLGYELTNQDVMEGMLHSGSDDVLFGILGTKLANTIGNMSIKVPEKLVRLKNAFVNNDIDSAWETYTGLTEYKGKELDDLIGQASKLFGKDIPDLTTTEGKKDAFRMVAMFDDTIKNQTQFALGYNSNAPSNMASYLYRSTAEAKKLMESDPVNAVQKVIDLDKQAKELYDNMKVSFNNSFKGIDIDFNPLLSKVNSTLDGLEQYKGGFSDRTIRNITAFRNSADNATSINDFIELGKQYNSVFGDLSKYSGGKGLPEAEYTAIKKLKDDFRSSMYKAIDNNAALTTEEKVMLKQNYEQTNKAYSDVKDLIKTDLYKASTTKQNIKSQEKILDNLISKAKESSIKGEIDDTSKILNALDDEEYSNLEKNIINRVMANNALDENGKLVSFGGVSNDLDSIKHIFKTPEANIMIANLKMFDKLLANDEVIFAATGAKPKISQSSSGLSKDYSMIGPIEQASVSRLFKRFQMVIPSIFRELGVEPLTSKLPLFKEWEKASKQNALTLNLADALGSSEDIPTLFNKIIQSDPKGLSEPVKRGLKDLMSDYNIVNKELQSISTEDRIKLQQEMENAKYPKQIEFKPKDFITTPSGKTMSADMQQEANTIMTAEKTVKELNRRAEGRTSYNPKGQFEDIKVQQKQPVDTTIEESKGIVPYSATKPKEDIIDVEVYERNKPKTLTPEQSTRYDNISQQIVDTQKEMQRVAKAQQLVDKQNISNAKKDTMRKEYAQQLRQLNAEIVTLRSKLPKK